MSVNVKNEIVVVGGGPAGSICAALLCQQGLRITLIAPPRPRYSWLEMLSPEGVLCLQRLGFDSSAFIATPQPCPGIVDTWDGDNPEISDFELTRCSVGWVINRNTFDDSLVEFARQLGASVITDDYRFVSEITDNPLVLESLTTGHKIEAGFVVDATGTTSRLMPQPYARRAWFDRLVAVRLTSQANLHNANWMQLGWSSAGWWYVLPCGDGTWQTVFMTDADLLPNSDLAMLRFLEFQFSSAFGIDPCFLTEESRNGFEIRSARTSCRKVLWSHYWMPTGDAAYSIDPISGGGLTRAFQMAEQTANTITRFASTSNPDGLQNLAVQRVQEFSKNLDLLHSYYEQRAERFQSAAPSSFWGRRRLQSKQQKIQNTPHL